MLRVLESPNSWEAFRKSGGFTGLLSVVVDMEGALSKPPYGEVWKNVGHQQLLELLLLVLRILALAVHLHDVNAHHFQAGGFYERLADALLQLGCFHTEALESEKWDGGRCFGPRTEEEKQTSRKSFFQFVELAEATCASNSPQPNLPVTLQMCIRLLSYLDDFASGTYTPQSLQSGQEPGNEYDEEKEKLHGPARNEGVNSGQLLSGSGLQSNEDKITAPSSPTVSMESQYRYVFALVRKCYNPDLLITFIYHVMSIYILLSFYSRFSFDQIIFHPGAIRVIMTLLPHVFSPEDPQVCCLMALFVSFIHLSLPRAEVIVF